MEARNPLEEAKEYIRNNDVEKLNALLQKTETHDVTFAEPIYVQTYSAQRDYDGYPIDGREDEYEFTGEYRKVTRKVTSLVLDITKHGDELLIEAVARRQFDIVNFLLNFRKRDTYFHSEYAPLAIQLTPKLLRKALDLISLSKINKANILHETSEGVVPITDISKNEYTKYTDILKILFIRFVDDNFKNRALMKKFFANLKKYFPLPDQADAFIAVVNHCLNKAINIINIGHQQNPILFQDLLSAFPNESRKIIDDEKLQSQMNIELKIIHNPHLLSDDEATQCNNVFNEQNGVLIRNITGILEFAKKKGFTLHKGERVALMEKIHNKALAIIKTDTISLTKFQDLILLLINARNKISRSLGESSIHKESTIMTAIDKILALAFNKPEIQHIFKLKSKNFKNHSETQLVSDQNNLTLYKFFITRLRNEGKLDEKKTAGRNPTSSP